MSLRTQITSVIQRIRDEFNLLRPIAERIVVPVGSTFALRAGQVRGWGEGHVDNTGALNLGSIGAVNLSRRSGGISFPFDVKLIGFRAWHRNSDADAEAWGWVIARQQKTDGSNARTTTYILDEVTDNAGVGPRNYGNNQNQLTDLDFSSLTTTTLPAGDVLILAVAAPTAAISNRNVEVQSGYLDFQRV